MPWKSIESAPRDGSEFLARLRRRDLYTGIREGYVYFDDRVKKFRWCAYESIADIYEWLPIGEVE